MEPNNPAQFDSRAEEVLTWYRHYSQLCAYDLAELAADRMFDPDDEASVPLRRAVEERYDEVMDAIRCEHPVSDITTHNTGHSGEVHECERCGKYL